MEIITVYSEPYESHTFCMWSKCGASCY